MSRLITNLLGPVCRECGCTEDRACLDLATGLGCSWTDESQTLCNVCARRLAAEWEAKEDHSAPTERELISVCAWCSPEWLQALPNASHGICPSCARVVRQELEASFLGLRSPLVESEVRS